MGHRIGRVPTGPPSSDSMSGACGANHQTQAWRRGTRRQALDVLRRVFGYDTFREGQQAIIDHLIAGGDALVLMPTGGGKSLCYQIPALCRPGIGIVVSPLIALMQDQVEALRQLGVRAAALNSTLEYGAARAIERQMREGSIDLVYVA